MVTCACSGHEQIGLNLVETLDPPSRLYLPIYRPDSQDKQCLVMFGRVAVQGSQAKALDRLTVPHNC